MDTTTNTDMTRHKYMVELLRFVPDRHLGGVYSLQKRTTIYVYDLAYYEKQGFKSAIRARNRDLINQAKNAVGLRNVRGTTERSGDTIIFYPSQNVVSNLNLSIEISAL